MAGQFISDNALDAALAYIADLAEKLYLCSAAPANYAGVAAVTKGNKTLTEGDGNGDYTIADAAVDGRTLTVTAQTDVSVTETATITHIALVDEGANELLAVHELASPIAVTNGQTVSLAAMTIRLPDAVSV